MRSFIPLFQFRLFLLSLGAVVAVVLSSGCGGGGSGTVVGPPGGGSNSFDRSNTATSKFSVNVQTGEVAITPLSSGRAIKSNGRAIFTGSTIQFNSSILLDQPGDAGRKVLNVSIINRNAEPIGQ